MTLERISIELTNRCSKGCWFCYNSSNADGSTEWAVDELVEFVTDCARHSVRAVSFGGGEPLQYPGVFEVLARLRGVLFRSLTSNGLLLDKPMLHELRRAAPDKVHLSIHFPGNRSEVDRVIRQVHQLSHAGIRSGVNLLVERSRLNDVIHAADLLRSSGIENDRIVYLPMRGADTPTPEEIARVAGNQPFQSMTCLTSCHASPRFCSISWDRRVAWCSYTSEKRLLREATFAGVTEALDGLGLEYCGGDETQSPPMVPLEF
ncbi:MAG: radical SAM protein [Planctomycetaceae bacterium]|nr:radical SAM protein [Planctomycetaceae bacterium]